MRLSVDAPDGERKSLEQRLFEAYQGGTSMRLSRQDVAAIVEDRYMAARITDTATVEAGKTPFTNAAGIILPPTSPPVESWGAFKQRVINTMRGWLQFRHEVCADTVGNTTPREITIVPEYAGVGIRPAGTGVHEVNDGDCVYVGFSTDWTPEVVVWPNINDPEGVVTNLADALESERLPWHEDQDEPEDDEEPSD